MHNTAKNSIKAILFVILYVFFIFFISLFKGIHLYDIKIPYITTSHIFLKLDKKLIFQADNINITSSGNYQSSALNIHKEFYLFSKILPFFQEIKLNNIKYNHKKIFDSIKLSNNNIYIYSKNLYIDGRFKINYNITDLKLNVLQYKNYIFEKISSVFYYTPNNIYAKIKLFFNNKPVFIALKINNSNIINTVFIPNLSIKYNNIEIYLNKYRLYGNLNINTYSFKEKSFCKSVAINDIKNKIKIKSIDNTIKFNNKYLYLTTKNTIINYKNYQINLLDSDSYYDFDSNALMLNSNKETALYNKYKLTSKFLTFNYNIKNKNLYLYTKNIKINNDINFSSKEFLLYKNNNTVFFLNNNSIKNKYFSFNTKKIKGNFSLISIADIIGKVFKFKTYIASPVVNIKTKEAKSKKIVINNIKFDKTVIKFSKKPYFFYTHSNTLLNKNVKDILSYFNLTLPIIQKYGFNDLNITLLSDFKTYRLKYIFHSKDSLFKIDNLSTPISYDKLTVSGNTKKTFINIYNLSFPYKYLNLKADANISINIPKKYLNSFTYIKKLDIAKYIQIKNFNEKIVVNLINNYAFLLNSAIFINIKNKIIYFYDLKRLLNYSPFHNIFEGGSAVIKLLKNNKINVSLNAQLKYPLILNQKNPKNINGSILINKKNIQVKTNLANVKIKNLKELTGIIKNKDINVTALFETIKNINKTINEISETNQSNNSSASDNFTTTIKGTDTNFIYNSHKFLTQQATFKYNKELNFSARYGKSFLYGYTKNHYLLIEGKHYNNKTLIPLLPFFNHFSKINLDFVLVHSPENFYTGKIYINSATVKELKTLNNIIAFINTLPALLTLHTPGYSSKGYKIKEGLISFIFYNNILYFKQIHIQGINLDFDGKGYINFNKNLIKLKLNVIVKLKLKDIPIVGKAISYLFFGKDGYMHVNIFVNGKIDNPKITKDLGLGIESPFILFKRAVTLPFNIF